MKKGKLKNYANGCVIQLRALLLVFAATVFFALPAFAAGYHSGILSKSIALLDGLFHQYSKL